MSIQHEIEQQLESLNKQQQCRFAWQCGLRALPFLSKIKNFAYWQDDSKAVYMESIFSSLIITAQAAFLNEFTDDKYDCPFTTLAYEAAQAADYNSADFAAHAVESVVCGSLAAGSKVSAAPYGSEVITLVAQAAEHTNAAAEQAGNNVIKNILFDDIQNLKYNEISVMNNRRNDVYGDLFWNFQTSLGSIECSHLSRFFDKQFDDHFDIVERAWLAYRCNRLYMQKQEWFRSLRGY